MIWKRLVFTIFLYITSMVYTLPHSWILIFDMAQCLNYILRVWPMVLTRDIKAKKSKSTTALKLFLFCAQKQVMTIFKMQQKIQIKSE